MHSITRHTGTLEIVQRIRNTPNGNPRWQVRIDGHSCVTKSDASYSYSLTNHAGKQIEATIGTHYGVATLDDIWPVRSQTMNLPSTYQDVLIGAIIRHGLRYQDQVLPVAYDGNAGSIYVTLGPIQVYATPGWEGDWSNLPVNTLDGDSDDQEFDYLDVTFTGNPNFDCRLWSAAVSAWIRDNVYPRGWAIAETS